MKFGIFVFGDNHPELGRSNQRYYEEVLTMAEWAEELGLDSFGSASIISTGTAPALRRRCSSQPSGSAQKESAWGPLYPFFLFIIL